jgi:hypothetical protein
MTFDLQRILESKRALRSGLAALPPAEKLRMLDRLRESALALRGATAKSTSRDDRVREGPEEYRTH